MTSTTETTTTASSTTPPQTPWWRAGGIFAPGQRFNIHAPGLILVLGTCSSLECLLYVAAWFLWVFAAKYLYRMKTETCIFSFASYAVSMFFSGYRLLAATEDTAAWLHSALRLLACVWIGTTLKVAISSSACLHRYGAHCAYKTDHRWLKYAICMVGALCNQGGIVWWSSHHRCHHKHCDLPLDPHSPKLVGLENAFAFFNSNRQLMQVNHDYVPRHLQEDPVVWVLDTFYWAFCTLEMVVGFVGWGWYGLFVSYVSGWWAQVGGMIFNVAFHLEESKSNCVATNGGTWFRHSEIFFPAFLLISLVAPTVAPLVGEYYHEIHHVKPQLAKRDSLDLGWYLWVYPLMKLGLIWDVHGFSSKQTAAKKVI